MEKVILSKVVIEKLDKMIYILFDKQYFSHLETSESYVGNILGFIFIIPSQPLRKTKIAKHGRYYARYLVKNKRTQYYITFNMKDGRYFIKNIFTSHESGYDTYIRGLK